MNMVETIKAGESETTEFKTSLAEWGDADLFQRRLRRCFACAPAEAGRGAAVRFALSRLFLLRRREFSYRNILECSNLGTFPTISRGAGITA